ncbi:hypothetical protein ILFOPFJJ_06869 [Ensifer psoraleae]|nr:hypothetical protein [Sinorhizobium psoraleae]NRP75945.1 hypothetical protein [Sinorhizobium psoraleae]
MAREGGPAGAVLQNIEQVPLAHARMHFGFEDDKPLWPAGRLLLLQMRHAARIDTQLRIRRKAGVHSGGCYRQLLFHPRGKLLPGARQSKVGAIIGQARLTFRPGQKLAAIIIKGFRSGDK